MKNITNDYDSNNYWKYWANYWYFIIGVNVIPADTKNKIPMIKWIEYQDKPIPLEIFEQWIKDGKFNGGVAIILGKVWRGKYKDYFLNGIDCDNKKAVEEICYYKEKNISVEELASKTLVEYHKDQPDKIFN